MQTYRTLADFDLTGKRVLLRAGFDVPLEDGRITDESRITALVSTMRYILDHGAALVILSHQDRPKGKVVPEMSQRPLVPVLERLLGCTVQFADSCVGETTKQMVDALTPGQVLLLENVRFDAREEANDPAFAQELASYADLYVNDAFPNCHRTHASMVGIPAAIPSCMGLELEEEVKHLGAVLENPARPLTLIVSGAKIETKLPVLSTFLNRGDHILVGGAIANTFLLAAGKNVGSSLAEASFGDQGRQILADAGLKIGLPVDAVVASSPDAAETQTVSVDAVPADKAIFDVGPQTAEQYAAIIGQSQTIVWNGPLGMYEKEQFSASGLRVAQALQEAAVRGATVIVGGGDTIDMHTKYGLDMSSYTFVSTGGGAMLDFLSGHPLPALDLLRSHQ
jgi:phosphoglycerate kinase